MPPSAGISRHLPALIQAYMKFTQYSTCRASDTILLLCPYSTSGHELCGQVKCTLVHALRLCIGRTVRRGSRGIALLFLDHDTRRWWGVSVTPRPLFTPGKDPVPIVREAGCGQTFLLFAHLMHFVQTTHRNCNEFCYSLTLTPCGYFTYYQV